MILEPAHSGKEKLIQWVDWRDFFVENLSPAFYNSEFLELDRNLRSQKNDYVELGEIVRPASIGLGNTSDIAWLAILRRGLIDIRSHSHSIIHSALLPPEAILVGTGSLPVRQPVPVAMWREDIWGGKGAVSSDIFAFESLASESIAWLSKELKESYCQSQVQRLLWGSNGSSSITTLDLLRIWVRQLPIEDQRYTGELVIRELKESRHEEKLRVLKNTYPLPVLSGATFEERRQQFEEYLGQELSAVPLAFVETSTSNPTSDLFAVRFLTSVTIGERFKFRLSGTPNPNSEQKWRQWYWDGKQDDYLIYHSLADDEGLCVPNYLFDRLASRLLAADPSPSLIKRWTRVSSGQNLLPNLDQIRNLLEGTSREDLDTGRGMESVLRHFIDLDGLGPQQESDLFHDAYNLLRQLFRPLLALRITREGRSAGVYFLAGNTQIESPFNEKASLEELSEHLLRILQPPPHFVEAASRRESIRRLSWFSHQINGPIGRADAALRDIEECLEKNPAMASVLVPDDSTARRMAAMANQPIESYQIGSRLETAVNAIHDLRKVNYQIRQLRRAQGDLTFASFRLSAIIGGEIQRARESLPNLLVRETMHADDEIEADAQLLAEVFQEVFNNSIRELKTRKIEEPAIEVTVSGTRSRMQITIRDNGLPSLMSMIERPFDEDSSTYASLGQGSGLGLTVVHEIVSRHGGACSLTPNRDTDGERVPGVTFTCELPSRKIT